MHGDYIALLDHDDVILPNALYENVKAINQYSADMLYSDEITLDGQLKHLIQFHFKVDYAPDFLRGVNYITHFLVFSKELFEKAGRRENPEYDGAQDYDLFCVCRKRRRKSIISPKFCTTGEATAVPPPRICPPRVMPLRREEKPLPPTLKGWT